MREVTNEYEAIAFLAELKNEFERRLGSLRAKQGENKSITLPLDSVEINARAIGRVAEVTVTQVFKNPYSEHLEAEYIFPLAGSSSVNGFKMIAGGRTVIGTIQERRAARAEYTRALNEGKRASLLEQERDDIFTMQVGNIPPKDRVTVELTYTEKLEFYEDGTTELRLPLVVAPRYVPGTPVVREQVGDGVLEDTDQVPDASRISPPRLAEGVNPDLSLTINVELTPELVPGRDWHDCRISDLSCSQHAVQCRTEDGVIRVNLAKANELLNRDFILKWRLVSENMTSSVVLFNEAGDAVEKRGYAMLSLVPPASAGTSKASRDVIFVLDRSGSMSGTKMVSAARACAILMSTLGPKDKFAINAFDDVCEWYDRGQGQGSPQANYFFNADTPGIEKGIAHLRDVSARGGTELGKALHESIDLINKTKTKGRIPVIVILTDGEVSNESSIFRLVQSAGADTRIFTIGIDTAVNSPLLKRLAALGGGTATSVVPGEQLEDALIQIGREIGAPLITGLQVESLTSGVTIDAMAPGRVPDLFCGRMAESLFRVTFDKDITVNPKFRIKGKLPNGRKYSEDVQAQIVKLDSVPRLWAREYIKELEDQFRMAPHQNELKQQIIDLSLQFSVLTRFTAFVAVDEAEVVNTTGEVRQLVQPVHMPEQWEMHQQGGFLAGHLNAWGSGAPSYGSAAGAAGGGISPSFYQPKKIGMFQLSDEDMDKLFSLAQDSGSSSHWDTPSAAPTPAPAPPTWGAPAGGWGTADSGANDPSLRSTWKSISNSTPPSAPPPPGPLPPRMNIPQPQSAPMPSPSQPAQPMRASKADHESAGKSADTFGVMSAWSTMKKLFLGGDSKPVESPDGIPVTRILNALKTFREAWMASWSEIGKGGVPDEDIIEAARKALIDALADHPVGFEVPLLQKFLRTSAIEYVAALQANGVTSWALYKSRSQFHKGFVDAMVEAEGAMLQLQGRQGAFWESNV